MKHKLILVFLISMVGITLFAGEVATDGGADLKISSRTSAGIDLDAPYRFGLKNELTSFSLVYHLLPYQGLTNRVISHQPVGYIDITLFHLDLIFEKALGYNPPGTVQANRYQTGAFVAGVAWGDWIIQLNAGGNEPFWSPWNKGLEFVNDKVKFTWAFLDSMVDARRTSYIHELDPQDSTVAQFQQDNPGVSDGLGLSLGGNTIGLMYNQDQFGVSIKAATQYAFDSVNITEENHNGIAVGIDSVLSPAGIPGLRGFLSSGTSINYNDDSDPDPLMFGLLVGYDMALNEALSIEPYAGTDIGLSLAGGEDQGIDFEVAGGVTMHWPGRGGWYEDYLVGGEGRVFPGMSVGYKLRGTSLDNSMYEHNAKFTLFEERGDEGVFYGLGSEMIVDLLDFTSEDWELLGTVYLDYSIPGFLGGTGILRPWTVLCYDNLPAQGTAGRTQDLKVNVGVKLLEGIPNADFGIEWNSGSLMFDPAEPVLGYVKIVSEIHF